MFMRSVHLTVVAVCTLATSVGYAQAKFVRSYEPLTKVLNKAEARYDVRISRIGALNRPDLFDLSQLRLVNTTQEADLGRTAITDTHARLHFQSPFSRLHKLLLGGTQITDGGLEHMQGMVHLEELWLHRTKVTGTGFKHLQHLPLLTHLVLSETALTTDGLKEVVKLHAFQRPAPMREMFLPRLDINQTKIQDIHCLDQAIGLYELHINDTLVDDISSLTKLPNLMNLQVGDTMLGDDDIDALLNCDALVGVNIERTKITPKGVLKLAHAIKNKGALPKLEAIGIDDSQATAEVKAALLDAGLTGAIQPKVKPKPPEET